MIPLLEARSITRRLPGPPPIDLVRDASLTIEKGCFTAIVGPSGCGKSSLLYLLGLIDRPTSGDILIDGEAVSDWSGDRLAQLRLRRFGFVFQFHFLLPEFSALENVLIPIRRLGALPPSEARDRAHALLEQFGLGGKPHATPDKLSGGERQRVAIARALGNDPDLIFGDEPTGNLDSANSQRVVETFRQLAHEQRRAVVCVTHDLSIASAADVRISMLDGHIVSIER